MNFSYAPKIAASLKESLLSRGHAGLLVQQQEKDLQPSPRLTPLKKEERVTEITGIVIGTYHGNTHLAAPQFERPIIMENAVPQQPGKIFRIIVYTPHYEPGMIRLDKNNSSEWMIPKTSGGGLGGQGLTNTLKIHPQDQYEPKQSDDQVNSSYPEDVFNYCNEVDQSMLTMDYTYQEQYKSQPKVGWTSNDGIFIFVSLTTVGFGNMMFTRSRMIPINS
ncbi:hypothetical protein CRE_17360 [Caenorhabditis remanei]|uniref:Uncharacterized protein n=1 Tax=Caenorhabditis remanei TaxID=31234 RepID=E3MS34_CAERE|nr:hypothetical protein CRE_17360 [Caenorhabditis remanei]